MIRNSLNKFGFWVIEREDVKYCPNYQIEVVELFFYEIRETIPGCMDEK